MILGRDRLKELGLHLNDLMTLSNQMVDLLKSLRHPWLIWVWKTFKCLNTGEITPEESFMNDYAEDNYKLETIRPANKRLRVILYEKYKKGNLHKVM